MRVAIYVRVSRETQETQNQLDVLTQWAAGRKWDVAGIYQEESSAWQLGQKYQRELKRLIEDARLGKFDTVVVWALDRITRKGILEIFRIWEQLGQYGVNIVSRQESWTEMAGSMTPLLLAIAGWMANMESNRIRERTLAGVARAKAAGKHCGRPAGSTDKKKRRRAGYFEREEARRAENAAQTSLPENSTK